MSPFVEDIIFNKVVDDYNIESLFHDRYQMESIIHKSGAGNVYIAIDTINEEKVIIKEARKKVYITEKILAIDLLLNEKCILKKLKGKVDIPNYIECFTIEGNLYLVEEFIDGQRLDILKPEYNLLIKRNSSELGRYNKKVKKIISNLFLSLYKNPSGGNNIRGYIFK